MEKTYYAEEHGHNSRLDELHAEILLRKLAHLNEYIARRKELALRYDRMLANTSLTLPRKGPYSDHVYYLYVCRHPERDEIISRMNDKDILLNVSYKWPIHTMKGYQYLGYKSGDLPHTEKAADEIFSLPMYPTLSDREQDTVVAELHEILKDLG
jgi:aminotransferase EvaB